MERPAALAKLSRLCLENADALLAALEHCATHDIGCFHINSQICGYAVADLPDADEIVRRFKGCGRFVKKHNLRTSFHPDQFVVLNSQRPEVAESSLQEIEYQAEAAAWMLLSDASARFRERQLPRSVL